MSELAIRSPSGSFDLLRPLRSFAGHEPTFFAAGALLWLAMLPTAFAAIVDPRKFQGVDIWDKPLKFQLSFGLYALTLVFFARFVPAGTKAKRWYRVYAIAVATAIVAESVWTVGAATLGTASHFNETAVGATLYSAMGLVALVLLSASGV